MLNKALVFGIIILFSLISVIPSSENFGEDKPFNTWVQDTIDNSEGYCYLKRLPMLGSYIIPMAEKLLAILTKSEREIHDIYVMDESPGQFNNKTPIGVFFPLRGKPRNLLSRRGD